MRVLVIPLVLLVTACASSGGGSAGEYPTMGNLAQIMRGILFTNSNILFDVQSIDPETPVSLNDPGAGATSTFSGIYSGWQVVENAAIALGEMAATINVRDRRCENGRPVPVDQADWAEFTQQLIDAADVMLVAARARDRDAASDATNDIAESCYVCHEVYRDVDDRCAVA